MKRVFAGSLALFGFLAAAALVATPTLAAPKRIAMSNGLAFAYTNMESASYVRHYQKLRTVPSQGGANYSSIELTYANFVAITGGESTAYQTFTVQAEILYQGVYHPVTFNGQSSASIGPGGNVTGQVAGLSLPAGAQFFERVRIVGAPGTQKYLVSHGARRVLLEGAIAGTNAGTNLLGGKEGHGAACSFNIQGGKITSASLTSPGSKYASGGTVAAFDPATQAEATVGYTNQSNGAMTSIVITDAGSNLSGQTKCVVAGGGGFGINSAIYAASLITGIPDIEGLKSVLIVGDSIARGYGSSDFLGDAKGNYGIYERAIGNRYATVSTALAGNAATAYKNATSHARMYQIVLPYVTHAMINLGTNDMAMGYAASSVANANILTANELRQAGIKVTFSTIVPRVSGTYATLAGQAPVAGFAAGGAADTYNMWLRNGANGMTSDWNLIDARAVYQDAATPTKWRVDSVMTSDGIHPNVQVGIPYGAAQLADRFDTLGAAGPSPGSVTGMEFVSYADNATINLSSAIKSVTVYGTGDVINGGAAEYTLSATAGGNTFNAGTRHATLNIGGVYNKVNIGPANTWINDSGTYNIYKLSAAGGGVGVISGNIFARGSKIDLRTLLASTAWDGNAASLDRYLKIWISDQTGVLLVTPSGNDTGTTYVAAKLTSYGSLTLSMLLKYSII